jgi:hypothetical protein
MIEEMRDSGDDLLQPDDLPFETVQTGFGFLVALERLVQNLI